MVSGLLGTMAGLALAGPIGGDGLQEVAFRAAVPEALLRAFDVAPGQFAQTNIGMTFPEVQTH